MNASFDLHTLACRNPDPRPCEVLITGAAGRIGSSLAEYARDRYSLTLLVHHEEKAAAIRPFGRIRVGSIEEEGFLRDLLDPIDTVVHLAADPSPDAGWESVRSVNIEGTYRLFHAAAEAGCRRVIFASSIHAVSGYPTGFQVHSEDPVNPGDLYGVSKCFGEALGRMMAEQKNLSCIALRIGAFQPRAKMRAADALPLMDAFISHRDLNQLICRCIDDVSIRFAIFHALSDNRFNRMDITPAKQLLGYAPEDDFTELNRELAQLHLRETVRPHNLLERAP
jgi:hypothetical protein